MIRMYVSATPSRKAPLVALPSGLVLLPRSSHLHAGAWLSIHRCSHESIDERQGFASTQPPGVGGGEPMAFSQRLARASREGLGNDSIEEGRTTLGYTDVRGGSQRGQIGADD